MIHANAPFEMYGAQAVHSKSARWKELGYSSFASFVNKECSHLVVTMANTLRDGVMDGQRYESFRRSLEQYEVPLVMFGCGVQAVHTQVSEVKLAPEAIEMVQYFSARTKAFGVRGQFTADVLHQHAGISNAYVTGCPSLFSRPQGLAQLRRELESPSGGEVAYCGTDYSKPEEQQLFLEAYKADHYLIEPVNKVLYGASLGLHDSIPPGLRKLKLDRGELLAFLKRRLRLFRQSHKWYEFNASSVSRTFGTRFHVNMASILSGKPALWLTHDSRTSELVEALSLPSAPLTEAPHSTSRFPDYSEFFASIDHHFERFAEYLSLNKLPQVPTLREVERGAKQLPVISKTFPTTSTLQGSLLPPDATAEAAELHETAKALLGTGKFAEAAAASDKCRQRIASHLYDFRQQLEQGTVPRCSIIVVTYRNEPDFASALWRIREATKDKGYEVIVVDNGNSNAQSTVAAFPGWYYVKMGFNYGCSGGRNIGATLAAGKYVVFIDDDGLIEPNAIEALLGTIETHQALAVRGRVIPKTPGSPVSNSYDLGEALRPSAINAEGISVFRRVAFLKVGGFDPLLAGHEGLVLSGELVKMAGPFSVLYEPAAVLLHDFSPSNATAAAKVAKQDSNKQYARFRYPDAEKLYGCLRDYDRAPHSVAGFAVRPSFHKYVSLEEAPPSLPPVSVLTTARNAGQFLESYVESLRAQTHQNFEVVFVDDGSTDGTGQLVQELFAGDRRLRFIAAPQIGRSAALNLAIGNATHEVCLIADADDISLITRLAASAMLMEEDPSLSCLSLWIFTEKNACHLGRPHSVAANDFAIRALFGMPASFPAFAFRKSHFRLPFDPSLTAGVDCDWIIRNMSATSQFRGKMFPIHGSYYRLHGGQISSTKRNLQREVATSRAIEVHERLIGSRLSSTEQVAVKVLTGWTAASAEHIPFLRSYESRLLSAAQKQFGTVEVLAGCLAHRLAEMQIEVAKAKSVAITQLAPQSVKPPGVKKSARLLLSALKRWLRSRLAGSKKVATRRERQAVAHQVQ